MKHTAISARTTAAMLNVLGVNAAAKNGRIHVTFAGPNHTASLTHAFSSADTMGIEAMRLAEDFEPDEFADKIFAEVYGMRPEETELGNLAADYDTMREDAEDIADQIAELVEIAFGPERMAA